MPGGDVKTIVRVAVAVGFVVVCVLGGVVAVAAVPPADRPILVACVGTLAPSDTQVGLRAGRG